LNVYLAVVVVYLVLLIGVAIRQSRRVKSQADFMVAGRSVPTLMLVGTLVCTWIGSGSLFGGAGLAFRDGVGDLWMSAGAWAGIVVVMFLATRVRKIADYSVPELLERRYNGAARLLGTLVVIIAYMTIAGYQFRGAGRLLNLVVPIDETVGGWMGHAPSAENTATGYFPTAALISALVIMSFTALAGMVSVVSIDIFNGILMIVGVFVGLFLVVSQVGGWSEVVARVPPTHFETFAGRGPGWAMGYFFPTFFLLLGESSMYQKFLSAKDGKAARRAAMGMVIGVVLIESAIAFLAIAGAAKYQGSSEFFGPDGVIAAKSEEIILHLARHDLPTVAGCLLMAGALAIIFSTANTFLMVPALNFGHDVYKRFLRPSASEKDVIRVQRIMIFVFGLLAFTLAFRFKTILGMAYMAYTMVGAGLTPALLAVFLWKRVTTQGAVASMLTGMVIVLLVNVFRSSLVELYPFMEDSTYDVYPAIVGSLACLIGVSLLTAPSPEAKWRPFMTAPEDDA